MPVVRFKGNKLDPETINALVAGTLVNGTTPSAWWKRQSVDFRQNFMDTIRTSMNNGESLQQAITRVVGGTIDGITVPGMMETTKKKAGALVSTSMSAVTNEAALKSFQANSDVIKWVTQLSTLDNRTSDICIAYSGQTWDLNTLAPVSQVGSTLPFNGGPPRHFNCRSRLRPVTKSFRELGLDKDEIPPGTRASMDGQVPADISFSDWLKTKPISFQDKLLGPKRANLWRNDKITLTQLVDMRGNPMTLSQIEKSLGIKPKPTFNPATSRTVNAPKPKLTPPKDIFDDIPVAKTPAQVEKVVEKVPMQDILDFNTQVVKLIGIEDWGAAQKFILEAGDAIPDSVKANAVQRIKDAKKQADKAAAKAEEHAKNFAEGWVKAAKTESEFNDLTAAAIDQALSEGDEAFMKRVALQIKKIREEKKPEWAAAQKKADEAAAAIIEDNALDAAENETIFNSWLKDALSEADDTLVKERILAQAEEIRTTHASKWALNDAKEEAAKGKFATAMTMVKKGTPEYDELMAAQKLQTKVLAQLSDAIHQNKVKNFDEWKEFVKNTLSKEIGDGLNKDYIRRSVLNSKLFEKWEQQAVWKQSTTQVDDWLVAGKLEEAEELLGKIPDTVPGWQDLKNKVLTAKKNLEEKIEKEFAGKVRGMLNEQGFPKATIEALEDDIKFIGTMKQGVYDDLVRAKFIEKAQFFEQQVADAADAVKALNKASKGVTAIADFTSGLPNTIRQHPGFNAVVKKQVQLADKKSVAARQQVRKALLKDISESDYDQYYDEIIKPALSDVTKKLGPKQLEAKLAEIKSKIKLASGDLDSIQVTPYVKDTTDWTAEVRKIFTTRQDQDNLFEVAQMFKFNGNDQKARYRLFDFMQGRSPNERRTIKEYIHSIANPKTLPNGKNWDEAVAEITSLHSNNAPRSAILKRIDEFTEGLGDGGKANFHQTIITRTGDDAVKTLDDLGFVKQGELSPQAQRIFDQKTKEGWPGEVPIPNLSADEIMQGAKEWAGTSTARWQQKITERMGRAPTVFDNADSRYGANSFGISKNEWIDHFKKPQNRFDGYEAELIYRYTGSLYGDLNGPLWHGSTDAKLMRGTVALNKALDKMPKHKGVLYRGENFRSGSGGGMAYAEAFYKPGETITTRGFWSTATNQAASFAKPGSGKDVTIYITSRGNNGAIIGPISRFEDTEMEVLYKAGAKFKVLKTKKNKTGTQLEVWLEEVK